ncbi:uncharacterized protein LOC125855999 [Solanum stenotomum]|uniref:uncharacterized protein LOC125855999 n=1 Tax=Solanum stenotomum TaxID=172797 RepID=UPI0020D11766|nr:uncharacterized protein LOC125855999 [Solanum stenotomum]
MTTSRVRDFIRINPPILNGSKIEEDPYEFIDEVYNVLAIVGVTPVEKSELTAYQLKGVAQILLNQWKVSIRIFSQGSSNSPRFNKERVSNLKPQGGNRSGSLLPTCAMCGRKNEGKCLAGYNACFACGNMDHKIRDCPLVAKNAGDSHCRAQPYPSSSPSG